MAAPLTTTELITSVRDNTDEDEIADISDARILRALNRGARNLYNIVAKKFDQVYMESTPATTDGTNELDIPDDAYGRRIEFLELEISTGNRVRLKRVEPNKLHNYQTGASNNQYPSVYTTRGQKIYLGPTPISGLTIYIYYAKRPGTLVKPLGRIVDKTSSTVVEIDASNSSLSTDVDSLAAFVNVIDPETGQIKSSMQLSNVNSTTLTFKSASLDRSTVYGNTISTSLASTVGIDDYICAIEGTCIMEFLADFSDYVTQYATVEIKRSLGLDTSADFAALKDYEGQVESMWVGREQDTQVAPRNPHWGRRFGKYRRLRT